MYYHCCPRTPCGMLHGQIKVLLHATFICHTKLQLYQGHYYEWMWGLIMHLQMHVTPVWKTVSHPSALHPSISNSMRYLRMLSQVVHIYSCDYVIGLYHFECLSCDLALENKTWIFCASVVLGHNLTRYPVGALVTDVCPLKEDIRHFFSSG